MANELTLTPGGALIVNTNHELDDLLKPLKTEIHLFDTYIAGTSHIQDQELFGELDVDEELLLLREDNEYDKKAIKVTNRQGKKLGYVPRQDNIIFSRLMDGGKILTAKVKTHEVKGKWHKVEIGIYLVDF